MQYAEAKAVFDGGKSDQIEDYRKRNPVMMRHVEAYAHAKVLRVSRSRAKKKRR